MAESTMNNPETVPAPIPAPSPASSSPFPTTVAGKFSYALSLKEEGNAFFKAGNYSKALGKYTRIFAFISGLKAPPASGMEAMLAQNPRNAAISPQVTPLEEKQIDDLTIQANGNIAACYMKLKEWKKSIDYSSKVLIQDSHHGKSYFRRGAARAALEDWENSLEDLEKAYEIIPNDAAIQNELIRVKKIFSDKQEVRRKKFAAAFQNNAGKS